MGLLTVSTLKNIHSQPVPIELVGHTLERVALRTP